MLTGADTADSDTVRRFHRATGGSCWFGLRFLDSVFQTLRLVAKLLSSSQEVLCIHLQVGTLLEERDDLAPKFIVRLRHIRPGSPTLQRRGDQEADDGRDRNRKPKRLSSHDGEDEASGHAASDPAEQEIPPGAKPEFPESDATMMIIQEAAAARTRRHQDKNVMSN